MMKEMERQPHASGSVLLKQITVLDASLSVHFNSCNSSSAGLSQLILISHSQVVSRESISTSSLKSQPKISRVNLIAARGILSSISGSVLLKQITVLDAIYWLYSAWNNVLESTVTKCFKRCGFGLDEITSENSIEYSEDIDDNIPLAAIKLTREIFGLPQISNKCFQNPTQTPHSHLHFRYHYHYQYISIHAIVLLQVCPN
jgi:hypothetical protein